MYALADADVVVAKCGSAITVGNRIPRYLIIRKCYRRRGRSIICLTHARRGNRDGALGDIGGRVESRGGQRVIAGVGTRDGNNRNMHRFAVADGLRIEVRRIGNREHVAADAVVGEGYRGGRGGIVGLVGVAHLKDMECP